MLKRYFGFNNCEMVFPKVENTRIVAHLYSSYRERYMFRVAKDGLSHDES